MPELMPAILSAFLICITYSIDDFIISFFTTGPGVENLSILIYNAAKKGVSPSINALSTLMFFTIMALLLIINLRSGGVKKMKPEAAPPES